MTAALSFAALLAWLVIPSAVAGVALHAHEMRQHHRRVITRSRQIRRQQGNMAR